MVDGVVALRVRNLALHTSNFTSYVRASLHGALCRMIGGAPFLYFAQCAGFAVNNRLASHRRQRRIVLRWDEWQPQCARGCRRGCGLIVIISIIVAGGQFVYGSWLRDDSIHNRCSCIQGTQKIVSACWFACQ